MVSGIHSSLSALKAFSVKAQVTASNAANANTDGFKKSQVYMVESRPGGVEPKVEQINTEGTQILRDTPEGPQFVELSNVDLGEVASNLIVAQRGFEANLVALRTQDEMTGSLMDIIG